MITHKTEFSLPQLLCPKRYNGASGHYSCTKASHSPTFGRSNTLPLNGISSPRPFRCRSTSLFCHLPRSSHASAIYVRTNMRPNRVGDTDEWTAPAFRRITYVPALSIFAYFTHASHVFSATHPRRRSTTIHDVIFDTALRRERTPTAAMSVHSLHVGNDNKLPQLRTLRNATGLLPVRKDDRTNFTISAKPKSCDYFTQ